MTPASLCNRAPPENESKKIFSGDSQHPMFPRRMNLKISLVVTVNAQSQWIHKDNRSTPNHSESIKPIRNERPPPHGLDTQFNYSHLYPQLQQQDESSKMNSNLFQDLASDQGRLVHPPGNSSSSDSTSTFKIECQCPFAVEICLKLPSEPPSKPFL